MVLTGHQPTRVTQKSQRPQKWHSMRLPTRYGGPHDVYKALGSVYEETQAFELQQRRLTVERQKQILVIYKCIEDRTTIGSSGGRYFHR